MGVSVNIGRVVGAPPYNAGDVSLRVRGQTEDMNNIYVKRCPDEDFDVCDPECTEESREAYRLLCGSGWRWLSTHYHPVMDKLCKNGDEYYVSYLTKEIVDEIWAVPVTGDKNDRDRLIFFRFWTKRALDLYGPEAGISFS